MPESFTCPGCGRTSHNPTDVAESYCAACATFWRALVPGAWSNHRRELHIDVGVMLEANGYEDTPGTREVLLDAWRKMAEQLGAELIEQV